MTAAQSELLSDILNDNVLKPEVKKEEKKVEPKKEVQNHSQQGSILRVDSRLIINHIYKCIIILSPIYSFFSYAKEINIRPVYNQYLHYLPPSLM